MNCKLSNDEIIEGEEVIELVADEDFDRLDVFLAVCALPKLILF